MRHRLSEKSALTLHMLHMLHVSGVCRKKKDIRRKSNGFELLPPLRRSPSLEEGGLRGSPVKAFRPCRRLDIGALRSPLSPFVRPLEDSYTTPGAGHTKKFSAQHPSPPLRRINQPFQRVDAAYTLVIGRRIVVERQNQFGV